MAASLFRRLRLEQLETRDAPTTLTSTTPIAAPTTTTTSLIDPTLSPATPTSTTVAALIVAVGGPTSGGGYDITVTGLTAANLQPGASLQVAIGQGIYAVSSYSVNQDGSVRLTLVNGSGLADAVAQATTVSVIIGNGGNTTTTTTTTPATSPIIDTTLNPAG